MFLPGSAISLTTDRIWETVLFSSLTINFCVLWSQFIPNFIHIFLPLLWKDHTREILSSREGEIFYLTRMFTDGIFHIAMPVAGITLFVTSDASTDPFFTFEKSFLIAFSIQLGRLLFVISRDILSRDHSANRATIIHHIVAIAIYIVIIFYKQSAILGLLGMILEGHMLLHESTKFVAKFDTKRVMTKVLTLLHILSAIAAVLFRALIPLAIVLIVCLKSNALQSLFAMEYLPLASFFLAAVFYLAISIWVIFKEVQQAHYICKKSKVFSKVVPQETVTAESSFVNPLAIKNWSLNMDGSVSKHFPSNYKNEESAKFMFDTDDLVPPPYHENPALEIESKETECRLVVQPPSVGEFEDVPL